MKRLKIDKKKQGFYLFLMISAYVSTAAFGIFYYFVGATLLGHVCLISFSLFVLLGIASFFTSQIVWLFRYSITIALTAFYLQVIYTGGMISPAMTEFIIPPLLAFFYRPLKDRYIFMVLSAIALISIWPLTMSGLTTNLVAPAYMLTNSMMSAVFVFSIVSIFSFLFRRTLARKNKLLANSMAELRETTQKLVHAEKMASLGIMSAGVAHEINNPLNFIKGGVEMLTSSHKYDVSVEPYIKAIDEGVKRASSIVHSLSHFSRESPEMDESCDIHKILDNCLVMMQHKIKYKVEIMKIYQKQPLVIKGNEGKLHQAALNLISNAVEAIGDYGTITLETKTLNNHLEISIADTGSGIEEDHLPKIHDPFFTTKAAGEGTGLGLSITYHIIQEHGGKIHVESKPSIGTKFTLVFPANGSVEYAE